MCPTGTRCLSLHKKASPQPLKVLRQPSHQGALVFDRLHFPPLSINTQLPRAARCVFATTDVPSVNFYRVPCNFGCTMFPGEASSPVRFCETRDQIARKSCGNSSRCGVVCALRACAPTGCVSGTGHVSFTPANSLLPNSAQAGTSRAGCIDRSLGDTQSPTLARSEKRWGGELSVCSCSRDRRERESERAGERVRVVFMSPSLHTSLLSLHTSLLLGPLLVGVALSPLYLPAAAAAQVGDCPCLGCRLCHWHRTS